MAIIKLDASREFAAPLLKQVNQWTQPQRNILYREGLSRVALIPLPILTLLDALWHCGATAIDLAKLPVQAVTGKRTTQIQRHVSYVARDLAVTVVAILPVLCVPRYASAIYERIGQFKGI